MAECKRRKRDALINITEGQVIKRIYFLRFSTC